MELRVYLGFFLIVIGLLAMLIGSIGLIRLPDFFARAHAASKVDTVGLMVTLIGIAVVNGPSLDAVKVLLAGLFIMLTNPVAAHALGRAAWRKGVKPWTRPESSDAAREEKR